MYYALLCNLSQKILVGQTVYQPKYIQQPKHSVKIPYALACICSKAFSEHHLTKILKIYACLACARWQKVDHEILWAIKDVNMNNTATVKVFWWTQSGLFLCCFLNWFWFQFCLALWMLDSCEKRTDMISGEQTLHKGYLTRIVWFCQKVMGNFL